MEYVIIGACIVVAIAGGIVLYVKNKRTKNELGNTAVVVSKTSSSKLQASEVANDPVIQIGILPADAISDETKLVEITDSKVLAHINNLVPGLAQAGNAANNATQAVKANGEVLYRAIIPAGAKLTDSKAMEGAVRGFYHGADGIRGHANLVAVEAQKGTAVVFFIKFCDVAISAKQDIRHPVGCSCHLLAKHFQGYFFGTFND